MITVGSMCNDKFEDKTFGDFLKDIGVTDDLDKSLGSINDQEDTRALILRSIEKDIQQYLPDIAAIWGDETVVVKVKDDCIYAVWRDHWMPTPDLYKLVYENGGVVEPKDFEKY